MNKINLGNPKILDLQLFLKKINNSTILYNNIYEILITIETEINNLEYPELKTKNKLNNLFANKIKDNKNKNWKNLSKIKWKL